MTNQEKFQLHVYVGALERDIQNETNEHQLIFAFAERIPAANIPPNPKNAAKVFLQFLVNRRSEPMKWMLPRQTVGLPRARSREPNNVIKL